MGADAPKVQEFSSDRSTPLHRGRPVIVGVGLAAVVVVGATVAAGRPVVAFAAGIVASVGGLLLVVLATWAGTVTVGDGVVELRRWIGRRVRLPLDDGLQGLRGRFASSLGHQSSQPRLVMRHDRVRGRIRLVEGVWRAQDTELIADAAGVETDRDVLDGRDWQARAPGLLPWAERRPYTAIVLGVVVLVAALGALIELLG